MAGLFCDSYDHYATANLLQKWNFGGATIQSAVSRTGPQAVQFSGAGGLWLTVDNVVGKTMICGTAVQLNGGFGEIMGFCSGVAIPFNVCYINVNGAGILQFVVVTPGFPTYTAAASTALHFGVWYSVQAKIVMSNSATGSIQVRLNNVLVINQSGIVTVDPGIPVANLFCIGGPGGGSTTYHDDTWLCDSTGGVNNDFLGDCIVVEQTPNADGHYLEWTPTGSATHANNVNSIPPNTAVYNATNTNGQRDTYLFPAPSIVTPATVPFRQSLHFAEKDVAGNRTMAPLLRQAGTDFLSLVNQSPSLNSYLYGRQVFDTNPVTSSAWVTADLSACEMGQEITS